MKRGRVLQDGARERKRGGFEAHSLKEIFDALRRETD
jgi:hypothetical protein